MKLQSQSSVHFLVSRALSTSSQVSLTSSVVSVLELETVLDQIFISTPGRIFCQQSDNNRNKVKRFNLSIHISASKTKQTKKRRLLSSVCIIFVLIVDRRKWPHKDRITEITVWWISNFKIGFFGLFDTVTRLCYKNNNNHKKKITNIFLC